MPVRFLLAATLGLLAVACLGGCIPHSQVDASPIVGQVLDRATRQPVAGAQVALTTLANAEARTQTDGDGRFRLAGVQHVQILLARVGSSHRSSDSSEPQ